MCFNLSSGMYEEPIPEGPKPSANASTRSSEITWRTETAGKCFT